MKNAKTKTDTKTMTQTMIMTIRQIDEDNKRMLKMKINLVSASDKK